ncbi:hypothetical protein E2542_SST09829 [Spatholobus suberectus]|nr:hypothetical protein E2542_SST09829 [Spatholobus suberectus]
MDNARVASIILCLLIVMMDVTAGILGLEAEIAQNKKAKSSSPHDGVECSNAFSRSPCYSQFAMWLHLHCEDCLLVLGAVGFGTLVMGTIANESSHGPCGFSDHPGFLKFGGICCFAHGLCCAAYYVLATTVM